MIKVIEDCLTIPVGTYFDYNGTRLKVVSALPCSGCFFHKKHLTEKEKEEDDICKQPPITEVGYCSALRRSDRISVVFKKIKN